MKNFILLNTAKFNRKTTTKRATILSIGLQEYNKNYCDNKRKYRFFEEPSSNRRNYLCPNTYYYISKLQTPSKHMRLNSDNKFYVIFKNYVRKQSTMSIIVNISPNHCNLCLYHAFICSSPMKLEFDLVLLKRQP